MTRVALRGARVLIDGALAADMAVIVEGDTIAALVDAADLPPGIAVQDLDGGVLAPGFIDTQVNGGGGVLFNDDPSVEAIRAIGAAHRRFGTTGFLPTLISDDPAVMARAVAAVQAAIDAGVPGVLGIHLEGPLLSPGRKGIHDAAKFIALDDDLFATMTALNRGATLVTLAPERVGSQNIARLAAAGTIVAAGHTDATFEEMRAGIAAGVRGVTHLFNAMSPLTSRSPGAVGAALDDQAIWCGVIVDGFHVDPAVLRIAMRARPLDRFMLVTDAMPPIGTEDRTFLLQGVSIRVEDGRCVDAAGTLAGAALDMAAAVRNSVAMVGIDVAAALGLAASSPAAFLGCSDRRGRIAAGLAADLVWLDDDLTVRETWIGGVADPARAPAQARLA